MRHSPAIGVLLAALAIGACGEQADSPLAPRPAPNGPTRIIVSNPGPYTQVSAGLTNTCAITTAGAAVCWGRDNIGQSSPPLSLQTGVAQVSAQDEISCALTTAGAVVCWGNVYQGAASVPAALQSGALQVSAAPIVLCGLTGAGAVVCWGRLPDLVPAEVQSGVTQISAAQYHQCALKNGGAICWWTGGGLRSVLPAARSGMKQVAALYDDECALTNAGGVLCWDRWGDMREIPVAAQSGVTAISAGFYHICALTGAGGVVCWGDNSYGQSSVPVAAQSGIKQVSAGGYHTCAVTNAGAILCWGSNFTGESGPPPIARHVPPTATFTAPWWAIVGQRVPVTFTDVQVPGIPTATSFTYAVDCGTGTFGAATTSSTGSCVVSAAADGYLEFRGKVIDQDGDYSTYSQYVTVISQADAAAYLYSSVAYTLIDPSVRAGLTDKLVAMQQSLAAGKPGTACNQLDAFLNQVRVQRGKAIDAPTADGWVQQGNDLRNALGC